MFVVFMYAFERNKSKQNEEKLGTTLIDFIHNHVSKNECL